MGFSSEMMLKGVIVANLHKHCLPLQILVVKETNDCLKICSLCDFEMVVSECHCLIKTWSYN